MNRLTELDEYGNADIIGVDSEDLQINLDFEGFNRVTEALNRLARYEDSGLEPEQCAKYAQAEKEGRLVVLPCKVGDTAYSNFKRSDFHDPVEMLVTSVIWSNGSYHLCADGKQVKQRLLFCGEDIGKTVFFAREDAEKALEGMNNDHRID